MKTITIELVEKPGDSYYSVNLNGHCEKVYSFIEDAPEGDPYNKELNLKKAMRYAKLLEESKEVVTTIYTKTV